VRRRPDLIESGARIHHVQRLIDPLEEGCPSCTSIIDAIDGAIPHISRRINFAVVAKAPIKQFVAHAKSRGWRHARLLSSAGNTYNRDYHAEGADGQLPIATVFARRDGEIHHTWSSELMLAPSDPGQDPPPCRLHVVDPRPHA
jgi:predicted dithiol-disulfide oxidoreductase (DUF899 family)